MEFPFLAEIDRDLRETFLQKLRIVWTHGSAALEGNTLTIGETLEVLTQGLTISGKPLSDHNEVVGHNRAIDLIYELCRKSEPIDSVDIFSLHKAVQTQVVVDIYQPVGNWKVEPNSAAIALDGKVASNDTYAHPKAVPDLMERWVNRLNESSPDKKDAPEVYAILHAGFVRVHPFADGNGRMARLLANIPLLKQGLPPITIPAIKRVQYITMLAKWQMNSGPVTRETDLFEIPTEFTLFCEKSWSEVHELIEETQQSQAARG